MPERAVYVLVVEGFADWEPAHAVAELRRHGQYRVESVGLTPAPVESMGGIRVLPSTTVTEVDPADVAVFILPGGDRWASVCTGSLLLAQAGLLAGRRATTHWGALDFLARMTRRYEWNEASASSMTASSHLRGYQPGSIWHLPSSNRFTDKLWPMKLPASCPTV